MRPDEYAALDATGLAALIAAGEVTPQQALAAAQARADATEPKLNAIPWRLDAHAAAQLAALDAGPFRGVPFLVKDYDQDVAGAPAANGSRALKARISERDNEYVARAKRAGLVIFGKTSTPEFALKGVTEPEGFGATRNPVALDRTPGGSSGGAAAVVAAGVVPMAGASDGGGSIRIPAAYCGLFGLRPSRGRVSSGPLHADVWEGASSEHVVTRSVRDSAAMLDALAGAAPGDPDLLAPPAAPFAELARRDPGPLRVAFTTRSPLGTPVHPEMVAAVAATARRLEALGHHVEEAAPAIDGLALAKTFFTLYMGQVAADLAALRAQGAKDADFELDTRALGLLGDALTAPEYIAQTRAWNVYGRALGAFHERFDITLMPTTAGPAPKVGALATPAWQRAALKPLLALGAGRLLLKSGRVEEMALANLKHTPFTQLANLTGTPAMSCPLALTADGLPLGLHFGAAMGREDLLLALAAQLEPDFVRGRCVV